MSLSRFFRIRTALVLSGYLVGATLALCTTVHAQTTPQPIVSPDVNEALVRMGKSLQAMELAFVADTLRAYAGPNGELLHIAHQSKIVVALIGFRGGEAGTGWCGKSGLVRGRERG